ncbi:MAG: GNAT family N-acetyltransferase, partial [Candidatus Limnocylindria bacterium]
MAAGESDIALRDGSTVHVRPVRPEDVGRIELFLGELSEEARWFRFFSGAADVGRMARWLTDVRGGVGLLAVTSDDALVVGHGQYIPDGKGSAEVAFAVADGWQGRGIATLLLAQLAEAAASEGVSQFTAVVMTSNHKMIDTFRASGFPVEVRTRTGELEVTFPTTMSEDGRRRFEGRERTAAVAAAEHVLRPRSVAIIGASRRPGSIGAAVMANLVAGGFTGPIFPVNPHTETIEGLHAYGSLGELPEAPELAVIALPAGQVVDVAHDCAASGVRALVVLSAGFSEVGEAGEQRQAELLAVCRAAGMRLVGPNCLGVINTDPVVSLNASFAPGAPPPGRVGFASQSGAFGIAALDLARTHGIGLSSFISAGDKADLSGNDFLQYWEADERTDVIALYLESFGNPAKFGHIARRITAHKPVIAVKSGRSAAGQRAASSHTGALLAAADTTVDALFRHAGVIRTDTVGEMFEVAAVLSRQPLPQGNRVAIVTNAGGPAILCADACEADGCHVEPLGEATRTARAAVLPAEASGTNPVDMIASATAADYQHALEAVLDDPDVDAVIAIFVRPLATRAADVVAAIRAVGASPRARGTPIIAVFLGPDVPANVEDGVPVFESVEEAARALGHATRYARHRSAPPDPPTPTPAAEGDQVAAMIADGLAAGGGWMSPAAAEALLRSLGLPIVESRSAATPHAVRRAAEALGGRVAVKATSPGLLHKSDLGAVRLGLTAAGAARAAREMRSSLEAAGVTLEGFLVQRMAPAGAELIVGVVGDPSFGPLVAVGAGGTTAELIGDVQVRLAPVGPREADAMLRELRTFPLLDGFRGAPRTDVRAVEDIIQRVAALAAVLPAEAAVTTPVDMIASATAADYQHALEAVLDDPDVDAVIAI